ncbi:hypothetical protein ACHAQH_009634 [Verticillium albo-atrum]
MDRIDRFAERVTTGLTVGHIAGIIAAAIVIARIFCPTAITYILAGLLRDTESASTWTVASASLQTSLWPTILRTDSHGNGGRVRTTIKIAVKSMPTLALITTIAGVVTPLGLREEFALLAERGATFSYIKDDSPYGMATSPRGVLDFTRLCSQGPGGPMSGPRACPYSDSVVEWKENSTGIYYNIPDTYNTSVPSILREVYSSGTQDGSTVSNFFDIEWRRLTTKRNELTDGFKPYAVGNYKQLDSFILDNEFKVMEGLVVDARMGGIGFRNHTIPEGLDHGATWTEDLLFIEPDTACVNTNLTFTFQISTNFSDDGGIKQLRLIDKGGFSRLNQTYPQIDHPNAQTNPDLYSRAYKAAWINNAYTMIYMNITNPRDNATGLEPFSYMNSKPGDEFIMESQGGDGYTALSLSTDFGNYLHMPMFNSSFDENPGNYSNPYNVSNRDFTAASVLCGGAGNIDLANLTNIYVGCGLLRGAPSRTDGGPSALQEDGSEWESPLHACAATVRATIKTVTFSINGTDSLDSLKVEKIEPKQYASENDYPLWGLEDLGDYDLKDIDLIWGLISQEYESRENLTTVRQRYFHIPGYSTNAASLSGAESSNLPAADFAQTTMNTVIDLSGKSWPFDLLGTASMAIFRRWQTLSPDPEKAAQVINLMWTDLAASAVVGTKGSLGGMNTGDQPANLRVRPVGRRITYDLLYGIPAFVLVALISFITLISLINTCFRKASIRRLRRRIGQLSVGRVFTTFLYPENSTLTMPSGEWRNANGEKTITVRTIAERGNGEGYYQYTRNASSSPGVERHGLVNMQKPSYSQL